MGMAASQVRLLALTDRLHDIELKSQQILAQKLALGTQKDALYNDYCDALEATNYMVAYRNDNGSARYVDATYQNLCTFNEDRFRQYALTDTVSGKIIVSDDEYDVYQSYKNDKYAFAMAMLDLEGGFGSAAANGNDSGTSLGLNEGNISNTNTTYLDGITTSTTGELTDYELELFENLAKTNEKLSSELNAYNAEDDETKKGELAAQLREVWANEVNNLLPKNVKGDGNDVLMTEAEMLAFAAAPESVRNSLQSYIDQIVDPECKDKQAAYNNFRDALYKIEKQDGNGGLRQAIFDKMSVLQNGEVDEFNNAEFDFYVNKWEAINQAGGCQVVDARYEGGEEGREWLENMVKAGLIVIQECGKDGWQDTSVATSTNGNYLIEDPDDADIKKAEAEYEHELDIIDRKETKMDNELAKLETERKAITTEMDSLKSVRDDNIDRTFGIFG